MRSPPGPERGAPQSRQTPTPGWLVAAVAARVPFVLARTCSPSGPCSAATCPWRSAWEISWAELGHGLDRCPPSGVGGAGAGRLDPAAAGGMPGDQIGAPAPWRSSCSRGSVNFVAVALLGALMAVGIVGPPPSPLWRTALARLARRNRDRGGGVDQGGSASHRRPRRTRTAPSAGGPAVRRALVGRRWREAIAPPAGRTTSSRSSALWATGRFDNFVLWATFHAVGAQPAHLGDPDGAT